MKNEKELIYIKTKKKKRKKINDKGSVKRRLIYIGKFI